MLLTFSHIVRQEERTRSYKDRRVIVQTVTAAYIGEDGHEYRKRFEAKFKPVVPQEGTHEQLNALNIQYNYTK